MLYIECLYVWLINKLKLKLNCYALFLAGLNHSIEYKNTSQHGNADGLSLLPVTRDSETADRGLRGDFPNVSDRRISSQRGYDPPGKEILFYRVCWNTKSKGG